MVDLQGVAEESQRRKEELSKIDTTCPGCGSPQVQLVGYSKELFNMRCRKRQVCGFRFGIIRRSHE